MAKQHPNSRANLRPVKTKKEARRRGTAGGMANAKRLKKAKSFKDIMNVLLEAQCLEDEHVKKIQQVMPDIELEDITNAMVISQAQVEQARAGNHKSFTLTRDTTGQKPIDKQEVTGGIALVWDDTEEQPTIEQLTEEFV